MDTLLLGKCIQQRTILTNLLGEEFGEYQRLTGLYLGGGLTVNEYFLGLRQVINRASKNDELKQTILSAHNEYISRLLSLAAQSSLAAGVDDEPAAQVETDGENYITGPKLCCGVFTLNSLQEAEILESIHKKQKAFGAISQYNRVNFELQGEAIPACSDSGLIPNEQYLKSRFRECADPRGIRLDNISTSDIWEALERLLLKYCHDDNSEGVLQNRDNVVWSNHAIKPFFL